MKKLLLIITIIGSTLIASNAYSQVYVNARVGFGVPVRRVYCAPVAPQVVYQQAYAPAPVVYENAFPGAAYYTYPAWHGHYHDRFYYEHYRPYYEREHRYYDRGYHHRW